jgi:transcriptional regulator with XRE-family HTH domain
MKAGAPGSLGVQLKALREAAGFTQEELATIAGLSVHAVSALERGERRRPHVETVRALSAALDLTAVTLSAFLGSARSELGRLKQVSWIKTVRASAWRYQAHRLVLLCQIL